MLICPIVTLEVVGKMVRGEGRKVGEDTTT
jgi:hypothetical protein